MKNFYQSYIRAFHKYAQSTLHSTFVKTITRYAILVNLKANQLIVRAKLNRRIDLPKLQKEIFEAGGDYIKKFVARLKQENRKEKAKDTP